MTTPLTRYKYVKYDTGGGYIREGLESHADGEWMKAADVEEMVKEARIVAERLIRVAELRTDEDALDLDEDWIQATRFIARLFIARLEGK